MDKARSQQFMLKLVGDVGTVLAAGALVVGDRVGLFRAMAGAGRGARRRLRQLLGRAIWPIAGFIQSS